MASYSDKETLTESWLRSLKNRPTAAVLLLVVVAATGIASFTDSVDKITKFFSEYSDAIRNAKEKDKDTRLEQELVGTWTDNAANQLIPGFVVKQVRLTFLSDGSYHISGSYSFFEMDLPISVSGTWSVKGSLLYWKVTSSNVPLVVKEGYSSATKIISVTSDKWTYIDPADGQAKSDFRLTE